jgi:hypothetical protein
MCSANALRLINLNYLIINSEPSSDLVEEEGI